MEFNNKYVYYKKIKKDELKFFGLEPELMQKIITDGRFLSQIAELKFEALFNNISSSGSNCKGNDFIYKDDSEKPFEMRVRTKNKKTIHLTPSCMRGKGRKYNEVEYIENLNKISGYVIVIQISIDEYIFFHIPSQTILNNNSPIKNINIKDMSDIDLFTKVENTVGKFRDYIKDNPSKLYQTIELKIK